MQQKSPFANATVEVDKQLANIYLHSYIDTNTQTSVGRQHLIPLWTYRHGKWLMSTNLASLVATEAYGMVAVWQSCSAGVEIESETKMFHKVS